MGKIECRTKRAMINKDDQEPRPQKGRILRAKDIIPGVEQTAGSDDEAGAVKFGVPQFNLSRDIMTGQRRQSSVRRKEMEVAEVRQKTEDGEQRTENKLLIAERGLQILREEGTKNIEQKTKKLVWRLAGGIETLRDSIISEIVARDIERLCIGR
jgi:hypothetical protein